MNLKMMFILAMTVLLFGCSSSETPNPLVGNWIRSDGGYRIQISSIDAQGKVDAKYFNPNPIRVAEATSKVEEGTTKIHITLNDQGYPNCTYELQIASDSGQLKGVYFQAAQNQFYDVVFDKAP